MNIHPTAILDAAVAAVQAIALDLQQQFESLPEPATDIASLMARFHEFNDPAEERMRTALQAITPDAMLVSEFDEDTPMSGAVWLFDPIDGAVQCIQRMPYWCTTAALLRDGQVELAVIDAPFRSATYTAIRGGGAWLNGQPIHVSTKSALEAAIVAGPQKPFIAGDSDLIDATARTLASVLHRVGAVRNLGPTSLQIADVASGRLDGLWQMGIDPGNLVAGSLIVIEAGGVVTDVDGNPWLPASESFVAAGPMLHAQLVAMLRTGPVDV